MKGDPNLRAAGRLRADDVDGGQRPDRRQGRRPGERSGRGRQDQPAERRGGPLPIRPILYDLSGDIVEPQPGRLRRVGGLNGGTIRLDGGLGMNPTRAATGQGDRRAGPGRDGVPEGAATRSMELLLGPTGRDWQLGSDVRIARSSWNIGIPALAASGRTRARLAADAEPTFLDRCGSTSSVYTEEGPEHRQLRTCIAAGARRCAGEHRHRPGALTRRRLALSPKAARCAGRPHVPRGRGIISFTSPTRIQPELDIELRTLAGNVDVALTNGTFDQLVGPSQYPARPGARCRAEAIISATTNTPTFRIVTLENPCPRYEPPRPSPSRDRSGPMPTTRAN